MHFRAATVSFKQACGPSVSAMNSTTACIARAALASRARPSPPHRAAGVTLVELLAVVSIIAILLSVGVPSYRYVNTSYRISAEANGLLGDLQYARSEAIREGQFVTACVSADGKTCALNNNAWQTGWIVFSDPNNNQTVDAGEAVLRVQTTFTGTDTFIASGNLSAVTFSREGFALGLPNAGITVSLHDATANAAWTRCLDMTVIGMLSVVTPATATAQRPCA